jgi:hypothetical protein
MKKDREWQRFLQDAVFFKKMLFYKNNPRLPENPASPGIKNQTPN